MLEVNIVLLAIIIFLYSSQYGKLTNMLQSITD